MEGTLRALHIIPVIDLQDGQAVHARQGNRSEYLPVRSVLCPDPDPQSLLLAYLGVFPFKTIYIADLDAIQGRGNNDALIERLAARFPGQEFWVDAGIELRTRKSARIRPVIGTESGFLPQDLQRVTGAVPNVVLSLDFRDSSLLGEPDVLLHPGLWPKQVIVMCLARVGSGRGPELDTATRVMSRAAGRRVYLAGGMRDIGDLRQVAASGIAGALVASCLHERAVVAADLTGFS
jgi:phosphoribosylformimino-5-aminoimidazole carboxamide ribotide isomerase